MIKSLLRKKTRVLVCAFACLRDPDRRYGSGRGGEVSLGWNIVKQIARFNQVWVLTDSGNSADIKGALKKENLPNVIFFYLALPGWLNFFKKVPGGIQIYSYLWQVKAYFVAKKLHKEVNFDVFHHITYANDWMASFAGALLPIPYIRGPGGGAHRVPRKFLKTFSFKERVANSIRSMGQWFFRHDPFFILGQNKTKAILVCNREAFNAMPKSWQKKAYFFPVNGISREDLSLFNLERRGSNDQFLILTAGKLLKIKGFDLVISAFKIFSEKAPDARFIIVGEGPELDNLKIMAGKMGIENKIIFEKWLPREELLKKMSICDVFVFPSLRDGGGNVVVEAMAAAKPIICFDISGPGFHVDGECGIKIKPENPEQAVGDMAKALERLYFNKELKIRLGMGAREKIEREYIWDKLGDKLFEIYKKSFLILN